MSYQPTNPNGSATSANSEPVVIASDQSAIPVTDASGATAANQAAGNTSLSTIATNTTAIATSANQTNGTQQAKMTDGTNVVGVLKNDGTVASAQNAQLVGGTYLSVPFTTTIVQAVGTTDAGNYSWVSVQFTSIGASGTYGFQTSNDNSTWVSQPLAASTATTSGFVTSGSTAVTYSGPVYGRYFRINIPAIASGTTAGTMVFSTTPRITAVQGVMAGQSGAWNVGSSTATGSAVPANAFYVAISDGTNLRGILGAANALNSTGTGIPTAALVAQLDDTSPTAITENQFGNVRMTADRSLMVNQVFSYNHISTAATTVVKASAGFIHAISVNTKGTVASTITVYDNTAGSGTVVGIIDSLNLSGAFVLDVTLGTGITIVTTGTVAPDLTVSWR